MKRFKVRIWYHWPSVYCTTYAEEVIQMQIQYFDMEAEGTNAQRTASGRAGRDFWHGNRLVPWHSVIGIEVEEIA